MYGGFAGTETQLSDRIFGTNETILSGDLSGNDDSTIAFNNATRNDNSYQIIQIYNGTNNVVIDGLTITGGHANSSGTQKDGAAIWIDGFAGNVTIKNCKLEKNVALNGGGAIRRNIDNTGTTLTIDQCVFQDNLARWAGGIYAVAAAVNGNATVNISNVLFARNTVTNNGSSIGLSASAIWIRSNQTNTTVTTNIINNTFTENSSNGTGQSLNNFTRATVALSETSTGRTVNATVANCIFWNNASTEKPITGVYETLPANLSIINSTAQGGFFGIPTSVQTNTSTSDPLFTDAPNADFTLSIGSPAIDNGDNTEVLGTEDLSNNARIANGDVDMGCYEFASQPTLSNDPIYEDHVFLLTAYPNPTSDELFIKTSAPISKVEIIDLNGKIHFQGTAQYLKLSHLASGIYFVKVYSDGIITSKRIIKE